MREGRLYKPNHNLYNHGVSILSPHGKVGRYIARFITHKKLTIDYFLAHSSAGRHELLISSQ